MTEQQKNGNKIIAEWMGGEVKSAWKIADHSENFVWYGEEAKKFRSITNMPDGNCILIEQCKFHSDWNWLHKAWDKIKIIPKIGEYDDYQGTIESSMLFGTIEQAFNELVKAIEWLNSLNKKA